MITARSAAGREAVELMRRGLTQVEAAAALDITPQAMSQRLRTAAWDLESDSLGLVADALAEADRLPSGGSA